MGRGVIFSVGKKKLFFVSMRYRNTEVARRR